MADAELSPHHKEQLDQRLQPFLERIEALERSHDQKNTDILILQHAYENVIKQLDLANEQIQKSKEKPQNGKPARTGSLIAESSKNIKAK